MTTQPFTNLDFNAVKTNLKSYLSGQDQFKDYDFEGSNMNVLLDILAYNTFQNNFYTNMAISEMFLDSAQLRDSIVSHAKELNYLPKSVRSSSIPINIEFFPTDSPNSVTIPARTKFLAKCGTKTFNFTNEVPYVIRRVNGRYVGSDIELFEGEYVEEIFRVSGDAVQRFVMSNENLDTRSLRVFVSDNEESVEENEYILKSSLYDVDSNDEVYYLQPHIGNKYEIIFGQNVFGSNPTSGNVIRVIYRRSAGEEANGATDISLVSSINGYSNNITPLTASQGGADREGIESIRYFAPKSIQIQERAVTENDYAVLLRRQFPEIGSVAVYGGENLSPPQYGRVVIAVYNNNSERLSDAKKTQYTNYLADRTAVTVTPVIIPAKFMYVDIEANVYYNTNATNASEGAISNIVNRAITLYDTNNLGEFKKNFRYSKLVSAIDNSEISILSNDTKVKAIISIAPERGDSEFHVLQFSNALEVDKISANPSLNDFKPAVESSSFVYSGRTVFIRDNGLGSLDIVSVNNGELSYIQRSIGTVDYNTGSVYIRPLTIQDYDGDYINVYARLASKDILAPKDRIIKIRNSDVAVNIFPRRQ